MAGKQESSIVLIVIVVIVVSLFVVFALQVLGPMSYGSGWPTPPIPCPDSVNPERCYDAAIATQTAKAAMPAWWPFGH